MVTPQLVCLHCRHEFSRRLAGKKRLTPPRQCPSCYTYLHVEDVDYEWTELAGFAWNYGAHQEALARRKRPAQRRAEPARSEREIQSASYEPEDILDTYPMIPDDQ